MTRERSESGQYIETVTLENVRDVFDQVRGPVITSTDVAEALDCTTESARQKLTQLYDRGEVDRRKTGRTVVWWRTTDAEENAEPVGEDGDE
ncbi:transcriptional regulator (plasmid) [Halarchaeum sp. CBA1220]|uniref:transcriptional regulator n=1 Tax=Halarchaeum sp. CBA1220 TaxID=1853682 RepID=UPI000F3AA61B|nr:transcriptional regulator [Halarchaeum sp. CBA1220]QLC35746.1 transcriptional regulator [Halarchaeum sp. CBA1220]